MTYFITILVVVAIVLLLFSIFKKPKGAKVAVVIEESLADLSIVDAQTGDVVTISGADEDYEDMNFTIDRKNRYEAGGDVWHELSGVSNHRRVFIECEDDDGPEVSIIRENDLKIGDIGVTEDQLGKMDEEESRTNFVEFGGEKFFYTDSGEVTYFKNDGARGEGFYSWSFEDEAGDRKLFVEKFEGDPFAVGISEKIDPGRATVFRS